MPEAVIVSVARSPIGRALKGSLAGMRPDDLLAQMVRAALDQVPELDPREIDDMMIGCVQPGGEADFTIARVVAVLLGMDHLPGTTVNRACASSLQTTRMAAHAIWSREGEAFVSGGVECVSRYPAHYLTGDAVVPHPEFVAAGRREAARVAAGEPWSDPREAGLMPDVYLAMGQTAENVAQARGISRAEQDEFGVRSQNLAEAAIASGFWPADITPVTLP
ncbi:MAG: acetyl-CoA C-acyltransferase, partial [Frankiales bacterium]|nr:acetyl-CoA C-acyltransferase [Frankiales bacterium]